MGTGDAEQVTLILVHGAGHGPWCWEEVQRLGTARGLRSIALALPSCADRVEDLGNTDDDIRAVRDMCAQIDGRVVLVGHSQGGMVISEAAAGLASVRHLVYVAAFMLEEGQSLVDVANLMPPVDWVFSDDGRAVGVRDPGSVFYGQCPPEVARDATARLRPQDATGAFRPLGTAAWRTIPSTYVVCNRDAVIPASFQREWATRAGVSHTLDADHSPFLSRPSELVTILEDTARRVASAEAAGSATRQLNSPPAMVR